MPHGQSQCALQKSAWRPILVQFFAANVRSLHQFVRAKPEKCRLPTEEVFMASMQFVVKYFSEIVMKRPDCASGGTD